MPPQGQNIIELGYNVDVFKQQSQQITEELERVFNAIINIEKTKIAPGSSGGIAELKAQIAAMQKEIEHLQAANLAFAQSQTKVTDATKQTSSATREEVSELKKKADVMTMLAERQKESYNNLKKNEEAFNSQSKELEKTTKWYQRIKEAYDNYNKKDRGDAPMGHKLRADLEKAENNLNIAIEKNEQLKKSVDESQKEYEQATKAANDFAAAAAKTPTPQAGETAVAPTTEDDAVKQAIDSQRMLIELYSQQEARLLDLTAVKKQLRAEFKASTISEEEYLEALSKVNEEQINTKRSQQELTTILRNIDKATDVTSGHLNQMRAELVLLQTAYAKMTKEQQESDFGKETQQRAKELSDAINEEQQKIGDYTKNIGRYAESLKPAFDKISEEIKRLKADREGLETKFQNLTPDQQQSQIGFNIKKDIDDTTASINNLERVIVKGFQTTTSYQQSINTLGKEFIELSNDGKISKEFLDQLGEVIKKGKADLKAYQDTISGGAQKTTSYTNAINTLKAALQAATQKVNELKEAKKLDTAEGQKAQKEMELLTVLVGQQSNGFSTLARELMATRQALLAMEEAGLQNTEMFEKLQTEYSEGKRKLDDFNKAQQIMTSSTPKLTALIAAARGLSGMYAAAAGAASLFGSENEEVQKQIQKLVAIMSILHGLQEVSELLDKKGAIAKVLLGTASAGTAVAMETEAVAATHATVATTAFGRALAFIQANPIILALTALAAVVLLVVANLDEQEKAFRSTEEAAQDYAKAIKTVAEANVTANKYLGGDRLEKEKELLQAQLDAAKARGASEATLLAMKQKVLDKEAEIAKANYDTNKQAIADNYESERITAAAANKRKQIAAEKLAELQKQKLEGKEFTDEIAQEVKISDMAGTKTITTYKKVSTAIEETQKDLEKYTEQYEAHNAVVEKYDEIIKKNTDTEKAAAENRLEISKLSAEERRKLDLATTQLEVQENLNKNNLILTNERTTFEQRIKAMRDNQEQLKRMAKAEKQDVIADPTRSREDKLIAERTYIKEIAKINREGNAEIEAATVAYHKRIYAAQYDAMRLTIQANAQASSDIASNQAKSFDERMTAYGDFYRDQQQLILADAAYQKKTKILLDEEIIALDIETKNRLLELAKRSQADISNIITSELNEQQNLRSSEARKYLAIDEFVVTKTTKNKQERAEKISKLEYDAQRKEILAAIKKDEEIINSTQTTEDAKLQAQIDYNNRVAALYKLDTDNFKAEEDKKKALTEQRHALEQQLITKSIDLIATLVGAGYEKQKNAIQDLINKNNEYANAETKRITESTLSEEEKADKLIQLQVATENKNKELARQQKELDIKKAKFDKAAAVAKIIQTNAVAIVTYASNPATLPLVPFIAALGALELAAALATPIPTYAEGVGKQPKDEAPVSSKANGHPGGPAIVGERKDKIPELVQEPGGKSYMVDKPTLIKDLPKGARVIPMTSDNVNAIRASSTEVITGIPAYKDGIGEYLKPAVYVYNNREIDRSTEKTVLRDNQVMADSREYINNTLKELRLQEVMTVDKINESLYDSMIVSTAERIMLVEKAQKEDSNKNDPWKIAEWQVAENRKALEDNNKKQPINITNKIDLDHAEWVNKYVFGK